MKYDSVKLIIPSLKTEENDICYKTTKISKIVLSFMNIFLNRSRIQYLLYILPDIMNARSVCVSHKSMNKIILGLGFMEQRGRIGDLKLKWLLLTAFFWDFLAAGILTAKKEQQEGLYKIETDSRGTDWKVTLSYTNLFI